MKHPVYGKTFGKTPMGVDCISEIKVGFKVFKTIVPYHKHSIMPPKAGKNTPVKKGGHAKNDSLRSTAKKKITRSRKYDNTCVNRGCPIIPSTGRAKWTPADDRVIAKAWALKVEFDKNRYLPK